MGDHTKIEWTDATWNALRGCSRVSEGCRNCYAEAMAGRFCDPGQWGHGIATREPESAERYVLRGRWTGQVVLDEQALVKPLRWKKPRRVFVTSIGDPFHPAVTNEMLDRLFAVMALCPRHIFQFLTKRPERMRTYLDDIVTPIRIASASVGIAVGDLRWSNPCGNDGWWPLRNVWLGVSVENQDAADERIPHLLATQAAVRFLSCEPLLGPVNLRAITMEDTRIDAMRGLQHDPYHGEPVTIPRIDWVIVGGESGPKARPMHPDWARQLRDQCAAAGVPFLFKQWGEWAACGSSDGEWPTDAGSLIRLASDGRRAPGGWSMQRVGKKAASRMLDGVEHNAFPATA